MPVAAPPACSALPGLVRVRGGEAACQRRGLVREWRGGEQLGKSLGGFFPSSASSLKRRGARPRTQVSFEMELGSPSAEQAAARQGRAGQGRASGRPGAPCPGCGVRMGQVGGSLWDVEVALPGPAEPQAWQSSSEKRAPWGLHRLGGRREEEEGGG